MPPGAGEGSSRALILVGGDWWAQGVPLLRWADRQDPSSTPFALDDATEAMEWESIKLGVTSAFEALDNAMAMLCDVVVPAGQVFHAHALWFYPSPGFLCFRPVFLRSALQLTAERNPGSCASRGTPGTTSSRRRGCRGRRPCNLPPPSRGWRSLLPLPRRRLTSELRRRTLIAVPRRRRT